MHFIVACALASPSSDAVASLPGYGKPPTRHFSGFLDASAAEPGTKLHYWLAEAETVTASTPVVLWLNGGPGARSAAAHRTQYIFASHCPC